MDSGTRKHYIDNLRWIMLLILIPYHAAMAWNVWGEPNYIIFEGNRAISSIVVFFSPYFMPLLFVLAGASTKYALQKRTVKEYLIERLKRLLIPFLFGTIIIMPILSFLADKFNCAYSGGFFGHYAVFFTRYTDLTGADGGFSIGQFWFLLYLLIISVVSVGVITLLNKVISVSGSTMPFWLVILLGLPLPLFGEWISPGGKSLVEYTYLFLLGYFVFSDDQTVRKAEKYSLLLFAIGMISTILDVYLFIWADAKHPLLNTVMSYTSEWIMVIALIGLAKRYLNFSGKVSNYMRNMSFLFYIYHFLWVVLFQYLLGVVCRNHTLVIFTGTLILANLMTFVCCEISVRVPILGLATGTKSRPHRE